MFDKRILSPKNIPLEYFTIYSVFTSFKTPLLEMFSVAFTIHQCTEIFKGEVACPNSNSDNWNNYKIITYLSTGGGRDFLKVVKFVEGDTEI